MKRKGITCLLIIVSFLHNSSAQKIAVGLNVAIAECSGDTVWMMGSGGSTIGFSYAAPTSINTIRDVASIACGEYYTIALKHDGGVLAWGSWGNVYMPIAIQGFHNIVSIASGNAHVFALQNDSTVWGLGNNADGELGDSTLTTSGVPVKVHNLTGVVSIAAGFSFSMALKSDGTVWAWGDNISGVLGDSTTVSRIAPVEVKNLSGVIAIAAGFEYALALKADGSVWAWGYNYSGQLGDSTVVDRHTPVQVKTINNCKAIAAGNETGYALMPDGTVWAWGNNVYGQIGDSTTINKHTPVPVKNLTNIISIKTSQLSDYVFAMKNDSSLYGWGWNNGNAIDSTTAESIIVPLMIPYVPKVADVATGENNSFFIKDRNNVYALGDNSNGKLGDFTTTAQRVVPEAISGLASGVEAVGAGYGNYVALRNDSTVWCWGRNYEGECGDGTTQDRMIPVSSNLSGVVSVSEKYWHTNAVKSDGSVWYWGDNTLNPTMVNGISGAAVVSSGAGFTVTLKSDGTVWTWGDNTYGECGNNSFSYRNTPGVVPGLSGIVQVSAGYTHSVALKNDGTVWAWGQGDALGINATSYTPSPAQAIGLSGIVEISAGHAYTVALKNDGTVWITGDNEGGVFGDQSDITLTFVQINGLSDIRHIAAGQANVLCIDGSGKLWNVGKGTAVGNAASSTPDTVKLFCDMDIVTSAQNIISPSIDNGEHFNIFPNPNDGRFVIALKEPLTKATLEIFNLVGEKLYMEELNATDNLIRYKLPAGLYFATVNQGDKRWTKKIIIE